MSDRRYRVLAVATHPVQYMSPIFRRMAAHPGFDLHVAYCSLRGAEAAHDPEFGTTIQWDVPLLEGYSWTHVPNRGSGREAFFGLRNPGVGKLIRGGKYDAVLCFAGYVRATFWIAYLAAQLSGSAFLFGTDASSITPRDGASWKPRIKRVAWPLLFRLADQVIVPSSAAVAMMRELGIPEDKISLTPFVVDNDWWIEQTRRSDRSITRAEWGVGEQDLAVLFCAKLQDWKRPLDLLRAFAKADIPEATLVFAGEGPLRARIESEAAALGVAARVRMLGFTNQSKLPAVYSAADLFVLPSGYDPCPVVVCEAMLCGLPVLLSDEIRGRFDLVRPGATGEIYRCGDVEALAETLRDLLGNRERLALLGRNARAAMETWSPRENVAATLGAIEKALEHKGLRPQKAAGDSSGAQASPDAAEKIRE